MLDQATVLELIDQLRVSVPDEVRQARRITEEAARIGERAREEGDAIIARAQEQAAQMLEERELVRAAKQRAGELLEPAQAEAREVRRGADEYAAGVLIRLEGECIKALTSIKRGIDMLDERHRPTADDGPGRSAGADRGRCRGAGPSRIPAMTAFNVAGLLHEPPGAIRDVRLRDHYVSLGADVELAGPLDADLRLQRTNRGILRARRASARRCDAPARAAPTPRRGGERRRRRGVPAELDPDTGAPIPIEADEARHARCTSTSITRSSWTASSTTSWR